MPLLNRAISLTSDGQRRALTISTLAGIYWATGRKLEALRHFEAALREMEADAGQEHPSTGMVLELYSAALKQAGRKQEAKTASSRAEAIRRAFAYQTNSNNASVAFADLK